MAEYKCISCGETKESGQPCLCPACGYKMFPTPFDRKSTLLSEINGFLSRLEIVGVSREDLVFKGKDADEKRFPTYDRVVRYVTGFARTEDFQKGLLRTVEQLKRHYTSPFSRIYPVSFERVVQRVEECDGVLRDAMRVIVPEVAADLPPIDFGIVSLAYAETPNSYLWSSANELLNSLEKLANKIVRFIKINNLYGDKHRYHPEPRKNEDDETRDPKDVLESAIAETETVLAKRYIIDIMDDGAAELREMLTCLWRGIELIMRSPLFIETFDYITAEGSCAEEEFLARLSGTLGARYRQLNAAFSAEARLPEKTEEKLLEYYKAFIALDRFGFFVPMGATLPDIGESEKKLNQLIGLSDIKESVRKIKAYAVANKGGNLNIHMCFLGNPGTGKTEVARYIAGILYENRILPKNKVVEVDRSGLVSQYFGATAEKTSQVIAKAMGGVLFIDEAYTLGNNSDAELTDYGKEAIDTLVKAMEDHRGKFCVVFAGYKNEMEKMLSVNPGLRSRIQFILDFPNYSRSELESIANLMLKSRGYAICAAAMSRMLDITDIKRKEPNFANAREIRNILDQVIMCQNLRCSDPEDKEIGLADVNKYIQDAKIRLPSVFGSENTRMLTGEEELDQLIGLANVKRMVRKIKAYAKRNRGSADFNLHMCFYGNPGTGKSEVARILSRILYDAGVLGEAKLVETDSRGLLGKRVGETAPKTEEKINDAMNGVLFIDEAYGLLGSGNAANYGAEAIAVLLKEMEDRRGKFCVILAGYRKEMEELMSANSGFASRIPFTLDFPDYTREELGEIAVAFLKKKKYEIENDALTRLLDVTEYFRQRPNFSNARTVRNILDQVILNQNLRTEDNADDFHVILGDVNDYITDEGIDLTSSTPKRQIGFSMD